MSGEKYTGRTTKSQTGDNLARELWNLDSSGGMSSIDIEGFSPGEVARPEPIDDFYLDDIIEVAPVKFNVQIRDLGDEDYTLNEPLLITIEEYPGEDEVIASYPELELFADGITESEAIAALKFEILDLYDELQKCLREEMLILPKVHN